MISDLLIYCFDQPGDSELHFLNLTLFVLINLHFFKFIRSISYLSTFTPKHSICFDHPVDSDLHFLHSNICVGVELVGLIVLPEKKLNKF